MTLFFEERHVCAGLLALSSPLLNWLGRRRVHKLVLSRFGPSIYGSEDKPIATCILVIATIKSLLISIASHGILWRSVSISKNLCYSSPDEHGAIASVVAFFCVYEACDLSLLLASRQLTLSGVVHHAIFMFLAADYLTFGRCPTVTLLLLLHDTSGIALNPFLLIRNRHKKVSREAAYYAFCAFALLFATHRLTFGWWALYYASECMGWLASRTVVIGCGYALQWCWAVLITRKLFA